MREQARIAREGVIADDGAVELAVHPAAVANDRIMPSVIGTSHQAAATAPAACSTISSQIAAVVSRTATRKRRSAGERERARALGPAQKRFELGAADSCGEPAVRREVLAPFERRRQFGDRALPGRDGGRRAGCSSQCCRASAPASGRRRAEPLQQRGAAEEIEVERVRMMLDGGGRLAGGRSRSQARPIRASANG